MQDAKFVHRVNGDGTHDSVCRICFATVATVRDETDLYTKERAHVCRDWFHEVLVRVVARHHAIDSKASWTHRRNAQVGEPPRFGVLSPRP
jgi:hypothetical protein